MSRHYGGLSYVLCITFISTRQARENYQTPLQTLPTKESGGCGQLPRETSVSAWHAMFGRMRVRRVTVTDPLREVHRELFARVDAQGVWVVAVWSKVPRSRKGTKETSGSLMCE